MNCSPSFRWTSVSILFGAARDGFWALILTGCTLGVVGATVPIGLLDERNTGVADHVAYALLAIAVAGPVILSTIVCMRVGRDDERYLTTEYYLADVPGFRYRVAASVLALRDWGVLTSAGVLSGLIFGLGDAARQSSLSLVRGNALRFAAVALLIVVVTAYVLLLSTALSVFLGRMFPALVVCQFFAACPIVLSLLAQQSLILTAVVRCTPYAPLWSLVDEGVVGRYALNMSASEASEVLVNVTIWSVAGLAIWWSSAKSGGLPLLPMVRTLLYRMWRHL